MSRLVSATDVALVLRRIFPLSWMYRVARLHGRLVYLFNRNRRLVVAHNLSPFAKNSNQLRTMTRKFFELRQIRVLMLVLFLEMEPAEWEQHLRLEGLEHLDTALSYGRGAILLGSHLNSIGVFMTLMILRNKGYQISVALPSKAELFPPTLFGKLMHQRRPRPTLAQLINGFYVQFNVRPIVRRLAKNEVIGQTGDGWHSVSFTSVPFLGRSLPFTTGMARVAQGTGAMVVPLNIVGEPPYLRCSISPPFHVPTEQGPGDEQLLRAVADYAAALERDLRANLVCWEHWLIPDTLNSMEGWPERSLRERYHV